MENNNKTGDFFTGTGIIIVILILVIGAVYFANQRIEKSKEFQATINQGEIATSSDDVSSMEKDANAMNFDDLGSGIDNL